MQANSYEPREGRPDELTVGVLAMPPPTRKENWIVQFVTELVVHTRPPVPHKYAYLVANREWVTHQDEPPAEALEPG